MNEFVKIADLLSVYGFPGLMVAVLIWSFVTRASTPSGNATAKRMDDVSEIQKRDSDRIAALEIEMARHQSVIEMRGQTIAEMRESIRYLQRAGRS